MLEPYLYETTWPCVGIILIIDTWSCVGTILIRDQLAMCGNPDHKRYTTPINTISYAIFTRHFLLELHIKGWQTFNINLYFTNVSYQYYISANDLLLVWLFVSINSLPWINLAIILLPTYRMVLDFSTTRTKHDKYLCWKSQISETVFYWI